jgi:two-component system response regulator AtoC
VKHVTIVDDDRRTRRVLQILIERLGLESRVFEDAEQALDSLRAESTALVLTDLKMPRVDGIEFMRELRQLDEGVPVIMLTAHGSIETAVEAMKLGAVDYLSKPFDVDVLESLIRRSLELSRHKRENRYFREVAEQSSGIEEIRGSSPAMQRVYDLIRKVAPTRSTVLITGETGTGKDLVARAIHKLSPRRDELFVPLNCSAIPAELLESELFGHVRGAFSGAMANREGKFQTADGGTLFLDEIGDMEYGLQAKLLRVLQEGVVQPVGSDRQVSVDVRIVSSTNRDLAGAIESGNFREDLFYRLNVFEIDVPTLADRRADIPTLAAGFLAQFGVELGKKTLHLDAAAAAELAAYPWRGNVRELRNVMERAAVLAESDEIDVELIRSLAPASHAGERKLPEDEPPVDLESAVAETERKTILRALAATDDNKAAAAALLRIGERTLFTKLKKYNI